MAFIPPIDIGEFDYDLPPGRIAQYPLEVRDRSKLLIAGDGNIREDRFRNLPAYLPDRSLLVYNKTRVIQARLQFRKESGALVEVFCLEPVEPTREIQQAFEQTSGVVWKCLVGNSRKWKEGALRHTFTLEGREVELVAVRRHRSVDNSLVEFRWDPPSLSFSGILQAAGLMPLPPYMKRESEESDKNRYQTIYARTEGSVAAPTAGLHFTPDVFADLKEKQVRIEEVTLHVGAGTFKPVSSRNVADHAMHTEEIHISRSTVESLLSSMGGPITAVGTTTLRTLESLYWHGVKAVVDHRREARIDILQWDPYRPEYNIGIPPGVALERILEIMKEKNMESLSGQTRLMIVPGYRVQVPEILVTNFHMPQSTLLLLVSAFIGEAWKRAYQYALDHDFRFLSYGDACLFFRSADDSGGQTA